jgi:hypothetical protein
MQCIGRCLHATVRRAAQPADTVAVSNTNGSADGSADGIANTRAGNRDADTVESHIYGGRRIVCAPGNRESNKLQRFVHQLDDELHGHCYDRERERHRILGYAGCGGNMYVHDHRRREQDRFAQYHRNHDDRRRQLDARASRARSRSGCSVTRRMRRKRFDAAHCAATTCSASVTTGAESAAKRKRAIYHRDSRGAGRKGTSSRVCVVIDEVSDNFR